MKIEGSRYSLCIAYEYNGSTWAYRVADYLIERTKFKSALYTDKNESEFSAVYDPLYVGLSLSDQNMMKLGQPSIREWWQKSKEEPKILYSEETQEFGSSFEIFYPSEIDYYSNLSDSEVRDILQKGIKIDSEISDEFLLVIGKSTTYINAVLCHKSNFIENDNLYSLKKYNTDIFHEPQYFKNYKIEKKDILSTENLLDHVYFDPSKQKRYFYCKTYLPKEFEIFYLKDESFYVNKFLRHFVKNNRAKYPFTKKQFNEIENILTDMKKSKDEMNIFFDQTGLDSKEFENIIQDTTDQILEYFSTSSEIEDIIQIIFFNKEEVKKKCINKGYALWQNENEQKLNQARTELENLNKNIELRNEEADAKSKKIKKLRNNIKILNEKIIQLQVNKEEIQTEIEKSLFSFKNEIVKTTKAIGIAESTHSDQKFSKIKKNIFIKSLNSITADNQIEIDPFDKVIEFEEEFNNNLSLNFADRFDLSETIVTALVCNKAVIVSDYCGEKIATAFSALIDKVDATYVCVTKPQVDINTIISSINNCSTQTVYIDGLVNTYDENTIMAICKNCDEKYIFLGVSTVDIIKAFSKNIFNYAIFVNTIDYLQSESNNKIKISENNLRKLAIKKVENDTIQSLCKNKTISNELKILFSEYFAVYSVLVSNTVGKTMTQFISLYCDDLSEKEKIYEILNIQFREE